MKIKVLIASFFIFTEAYALRATYQGISIQLPNSWYLSSSVIHDDSGAKVGEFVSKYSWRYKSGNEFVDFFRDGFIDDSDTTKFIDSGTNGEIFWVCRLGEYQDGKGSFDLWYSRIFWVNGPLVIFYSNESCEDQFKEALQIAETLKEL